MVKRFVFVVVLASLFIYVSIYIYGKSYSTSAKLVNPGTPLVVKPGTRVKLNGEIISKKGSSSTYDWSFYSIPEQSRAVLSDPNSNNSFFTADTPGDYFINLIVNNDKGNTLEWGYVVYAYDFSSLDEKRSVKIPSNVDIQRANPEMVYANEENDLELRFVLSEDIPEGTIFKFTPECDKEKIKNKGYKLEISGMADPRYLKDNEFQTPVDLPAGTTITAMFYGVSFPIKGKKCFYLERIDDDVVGKKEFLKKFVYLYYQLYFNPQKFIGACLVNVDGGDMDHIRAYAPSQAIINKPFSILIRPEDKSNNLSHRRIRYVEIHAGAQTWETECIQIPGSTSCKVSVSLPAEGVYRLKVTEKDSGKFDTTNPVICKNVFDKYNAYWGVIHGHSEISWDAMGSLDRYYLQIRDEAALDFAASSEHSSPLSNPDISWERIVQKVKEYNQPGKFITLLGYEWDDWRADGDGDICVYYSNDKSPIYKSLYHNGRNALFNVLRENNEQPILIPHHTAEVYSYCDWKNHDPRLERLVEIFQIRGSFECAREEGNPWHPDKRTYPKGYVRDALECGWRVGFTAGGDDHLGMAGIDGLYRLQTKDGVMCVLATALTREAVWDALFNRRVIATSGARIRLNYEVDGYPLGSELDTMTNPDLVDKRCLHIAFHGTAPFEQVQIIRNNIIVHSIAGNGIDLDLEANWQDNLPIDEISMPPNRFSQYPYVFYYLRVIQSDREMAWASPTWIDVK